MWRQIFHMTSLQIYLPTTGVCPQGEPAAGMTATGIHLTDAYMSMFGSVEEVYAHTARRNQNLNGDVLSFHVRFRSGATGFLTRFWRRRSISAIVSLDQRPG